MNDREFVEARLADAAIQATDAEIDYFVTALPMVHELAALMYVAVDAETTRSALTFAGLVQE